MDDILTNPQRITELADSTEKLKKRNPFVLIAELNYKRQVQTIESTGV